MGNALLWDLTLASVSKLQLGGIMLQGAMARAGAWMQSRWRGQADAREEIEMKYHPHCYHINFTHETETCCWCSDIRKLKFGQGHFDLDVGMTTPLLSVWWWRYNPKMYALYQHIKQFGTPKIAHGPYGINNGLFVEYADEDLCSMRKQP